MQPADELSKRSRAEGQHLLAPRAAHPTRLKDVPQPECQDAVGDQQAHLDHAPEQTAGQPQLRLLFPRNSTLRGCCCHA